VATVLSAGEQKFLLAEIHELRAEMRENKKQIAILNGCVLMAKREIQFRFKQLRPRKKKVDRQSST
jgi:hypothetical protein